MLRKFCPTFYYLLTGWRLRLTVKSFLYIISNSRIAPYNLRSNLVPSWALYQIGPRVASRFRISMKKVRGLFFADQTVNRWLTLLRPRLECLVVTPCITQRRALRPQLAHYSAASGGGGRPNRTETLFKVFNFYPPTHHHVVNRPLLLAPLEVEGYSSLTLRSAP